MQGVDIPVNVNRLGQCILSVFALGEGRSEVRQGPTYGWAFTEKRLDLYNGGLRLP